MCCIGSRRCQNNLGVARELNGACFARKVTEGYTTVFDRSAIPDVFDCLGQSFPKWQIVTKGKHSISLVRDIKNGVMDAAFIGLHTETPGLCEEAIHEEHLVVALSAKHPLARKRKLGFDELCGEPLFWFERRLNPGFYDYCQAFFEQIGFKPKIIPEPPDHHIMLGLIAEGHGLALIPASLQNVKRQGVVFRALKGDSNSLSMGIAVTYLKSNSSPVLPAFLELLRAKKILRTQASDSHVVE